MTRTGQQGLDPMKGTPENSLDTTTTLNLW